MVGSTTTTTIAGVIPYALVRGSLKLRDDSVAPVALKKRRIVFKSNTKRDSDPHRIHPPSGPGFPHDPTVNGATLTVYNSNPAPGSPIDDVVIQLPAGKWFRGKGFLEFRYVDTDPAAAIQKVILKPDSLLVKGGGPNWPYTLNEAAQGSVAVRLLMGIPTLNIATFAYCTDTPPKVSSSGKSHDFVDKFDGDTKVPPPVCPARKNGGSPSGAFLSD